MRVINQKKFCVYEIPCLMHYCNKICDTSINFSNVIISKVDKTLSPLPNKEYYESISFMIVDAKFLSKMLSKSNLIIVFDLQLVNSANVEPSYTEN